jgi:hypothetical protein
MFLIVLAVETLLSTWIAKQTGDQTAKWLAIFSWVVLGAVVLYAIWLATKEIPA